MIKIQIHSTVKVHLLPNSTSNEEIKALVDVGTYVLDEKYSYV